MYVIDLLRDVNQKKVIKHLTKIPWFYDEVNYDNRLTSEEKKILKKKIKKLYIDRYAEIIKKEDIIYDDSRILFVHKRLEDNNSDFYDCAEISLKNIDYILENIKMKEFKDFLNFKNPLNGLLFLKPNEILGFRISEKNLSKVGRTKFATAVFYCLTTFSTNEERREERQKEILDMLENADKNVDNKKTYSEDELYAFLGMKKEKISKIEKDRRYCSSLCDTLKQIINYVYDLQEILVHENIITDDFNEEK